MAYVLAHVDTCAPDYLTDHCNRDNELLLGVSVHGEDTNRDVQHFLLDELNSLDPGEPGFDHKAARCAIRAYFAERKAFALFDAALPDTGESADYDDMPSHAYFRLSW